MTYSPPAITSSGLTISNYTDIINYYIDGMKNIYGQDIYLGNDTADYQLLAILALSATDVMSCCQYAYNAFGALTTVGAAQDQLYKLTGITRKVASYSTCILVLTGTAGVTITNGKAQDINNYIWDLPTTVTFDSNGNATATATCETLGAISALPGNINIIYTPTYGWLSVTNSTIPIMGNPVETDAQFRARQALSTQIASISPVNSVEAAVAAVTGVTRYVVFENPTGSAATDPNGLGLPSHSITVVTEGGNSTTIATAIWEKKTPGTFSNGTTTIDITDIYNNITPISFDILQYNPIYVTINIHELLGYSSSIGTAIKNAVVSYLNAPAIGEVVYISAIQAVAMTANPDINKPVFIIASITAGTSQGGQSTSDIAVAYNYAAQGLLANIAVNAIV